MFVVPTRLLLCALAVAHAAAPTSADTAPAPSLVHVVAPTHAHPHATAHHAVLMGALAAQTDGDWTLEFVNDGPDGFERMHAQVAELARLMGVGGRVTATSTARPAARDGGHTPRAVGLARSRGLYVEVAAAAAITTAAPARYRYCLLLVLLRLLRSPRHCYYTTTQVLLLLLLYCQPTRASLRYTVLTGSDNYYAPGFVEAVRRAVDGGATGGGPPVGALLVDFVLDAKGDDVARAAVSAAGTLDAVPGYRSLPLVVDGNVTTLRWKVGDDLRNVSARFLDEHPALSSGHSCDAAMGGGGDADGRACLLELLQRRIEAVQDGEAARPPPPPYQCKSASLANHDPSGAALDNDGRYDGGALVFDTALGQAVGYTKRHHAADYEFGRDVAAAVLAAGGSVVHVPQTLFVHN